MKKVLSMLVALAMVLALLPVSAFAAEGVTIKFETDFTDELAVDDTFTVTASLSDNPGMGTITLSLDWDPDVVAFTGFKMNGRVFDSEVFNASMGYTAPVVNQTLGILNAVDVYGYDLDGTLFTANFKIVGEGELGIGLKTDTASEFQIRNVEGTADIPANLDFSDVEGLRVGDEPTGPVMPDGVPFIEVTSNRGPAIAIEDCGTLTVDPWGMGMGTDVPYYHLTIPAGATEAYVKFNGGISAFMKQTASDGSPEIGSSWSIANEGETESGMAGLSFIESGDQTVVIIPLEFNGDPWGGEDMKSTVKVYDEEYEEYELYYAVGPQDSDANTIALFSLEFGAASDEEVTTYPITVNQTTGGTITVYNVNNEEITEAAADDYVRVQVDVAAGYKFKNVTVNGEGVYLENGFFKMPAEAVTVSAVFEALHTCAYDKEVAENKYLKDEATCKSGAVYYMSCACGEAGTATFTYGDPVDCVYVDGVCKWCGAAEPVQTPGYRFATSADLTAENGGTAVVRVKVTGHSDENVTTYNAYDLTLTYDNTKLEFVSGEGAVSGDQIKIEKKGENQIQIVGVGDAKTFDVEVAKLTFKTLAEGAANITIDKVQISDNDDAVNKDIPDATPKHDENDTTADNTPDESVIVVPFSVTKPDFISGNDKVLAGETYTFSFTDTDNYTYSELKVTMGGTEVTPSEADGVYTIENVTGAIIIEANKTANSYNVTKPENVNGADKATYGTDYVFTVTASEGKEIESVTVTTENGTISYTINENGEYVIAGTAISGPFTITVEEKDKEVPTVKYTNITFSGINAEEIEGGQLNVQAEAGKDFSFELIQTEGVAYTVKIGETELTANEDGIYTIPADLMIEGDLIVTIEKVENINVEVAEYVKLNGKSMFLVTAKSAATDSVLKYGEETMYRSSKYEAYSWLVISEENAETVKAEAQAAISIAADSIAPVVDYDCDVNGTTKVDVNDAQLVYDMYNAAYSEFTDILTMKKFLEADVDGSKTLGTQDVAAIINYIVTNVAN